MCARKGKDKDEPIATRAHRTRSVAIFRAMLPTPTLSFAGVRLPSVPPGGGLRFLPRMFPRAYAAGDEAAGAGTGALPKPAPSLASGQPLVPVAAASKEKIPFFAPPPPRQAGSFQELVTVRMKEEPIVLVGLSLTVAALVGEHVTLRSAASSRQPLPLARSAAGCAAGSHSRGSLLRRRRVPVRETRLAQAAAVHARTRVLPSRDYCVAVGVRCVAQGGPEATALKPGGSCRGARCKLGASDDRGAAKLCFAFAFSLFPIFGGVLGGPGGSAGDAQLVPPIGAHLRGSPRAPLRACAQAARDRMDPHGFTRRAESRVSRSPSRAN